MVKVILIMEFSQPYAEYSNKPLPEVNSWYTSEGKPVFIDGEDWQDLLLIALARYSNDYHCEVWQPDLHADKVYSARFQTNFIHRNFPAKQIRSLKRFKVHTEIESMDILARVSAEDSPDTVFILPVHAYDSWVNRIIRSVKHNEILYYNFLNSGLLLPPQIDSPNPLRAVNRLLIAIEKKHRIGKVRHLLTTNDNPDAAMKLRKTYPQLKLHLFNWGIDISFWRYAVDKPEARKNLGISPTDFVIVLSQRLVPVYQIDKFIEALSRVRSQRQFSCYITGHGERNYEAYLQGVIMNCRLESRITLVGRVPDDILRLYFIAADLYAAVPVIFAGSGGAVKCMAIGTPIMHVPSGYSFEFLKENNAGVFVSPIDYVEWTRTLEETIDGKEIRVVPIEIVQETFDWSKTGRDLFQALQATLGRE